MRAESPTGIVFPRGHAALLPHRHDGGAAGFAATVLADAVRDYDADLAQSVETPDSVLARLGHADWQHRFAAAFRALTALSASAPEASRGIAAGGLRSARALLRYRDPSGGPAVPLGAVELPGPGKFSTGTVGGHRAPATGLRVPYQGKLLSGEALRDQLHQWRARGLFEPSFVAAIERVIDNPQWLALPGHQLVLSGASADLSPYRPFVSWGARLIVVDPPGRRRWTALLRAARAGAATVRYPSGAAGPGVDITRDFPALLRWIQTAATASLPVVFGEYTMSGGAGAIRSAAGADIIATGLTQWRADTVLAYLGEPTDCYAVRAEVMAEARRRRASRGVRGAAQDLLRALSLSTLYQPNYRQEVVDPAGTHWGIADGITGVPGADAIFAKRLQRWRSVTSWVAGHPVSFTVAPPTWSRLAREHPALAASYRGASRFGIEVFAPATARTLLAAKLAADLYAPDVIAPESNPEELFFAGAAHGGLWRQPFEPASALFIAAATGYPQRLISRR